MTLRQNCGTTPELNVQRRVNSILPPFNCTCYLPSDYYNDNVDNTSSIRESNKFDRVHSYLRIFCTYYFSSPLMALLIKL